MLLCSLVLWCLLSDVCALTLYAGGPHFVFRGLGLDVRRRAGSKLPSVRLAVTMSGIFVVLAPTPASRTISEPLLLGRMGYQVPRLLVAVQHVLCM